MTEQTQKESVVLQYRDGSNGNVFHASLQEKQGGFVVRYGFGPRGSPMPADARCSAPRDYATAKAAFDRLVNEQMRRGYVPCEGESA